MGAPCLLEPWDRLVDARSKQMHRTDLPVPGGQIAIARAEADCIFRGQDYLVHRSDEKLSPTKPSISVREVAIERDAVSYSIAASSNRDGSRIDCARSTWPFT